MSKQTANASGPPTLTGLFLIFSRIGLTSFGGGLSGWLLREFVQERHWISEEDFLNGLAISQALPGINVKNMAIWIGHRLLGWRGALLAVTGIIVPPAVFIIILGTAFTYLLHFPPAHVLLAGAAAAATGLSLSMGVTTARRVPRTLSPMLFLAGTFVAIGVLRLPLVWVVTGAGGLSVLSEYTKLRTQLRKA
ncbi:chromate transporter [Paraburkholderia terricola]|uniref:Chromate transporter n=1 Tax=Paraburkholderia terricola TaxID=169427 RepID=A0ABU1LZP7_9BURK|nr:chromate transporter [Paraburkholderia terricola]MDR6411965.1 chromate transporter [Paraburkholderia terricola]MDR6484533.1 chromate transporter [Paraburkholderia terricola]